MVRKLLDITPARFEKHTGGYTRIIRSRNRKGIVLHRDVSVLGSMEKFGVPRMLRMDLRWQLGVIATPADLGAAVVKHLHQARSAVWYMMRETE